MRIERWQGARLTEVITVRALPEERRLAEEAAAAAGVTLADLMRAGMRAVTDEVLRSAPDESRT